MADNNFTQKDLDKATADQKITSKLESIEGKIDNLDKKVDSNFVTKIEFAVYQAKVDPYISAMRYTIAFILISVLGMAAVVIGLKN